MLHGKLFNNPYLNNPNFPINPNNPVKKSIYQNIGVFISLANIIPTFNPTIKISRQLIKKLA